MAKFKDLTGKKFNMLLVLFKAKNKYGRVYWVCQCDCGSKPKEIMSKHLVSGATISCGCYRPDRTIDITGKRFNRWTVQRRAKNDNNGKSRWLCLCDCGNTGINTYSTLATGHSKSCGCYKQENDGTHTFQDLTGKKFGRLMVLSRAINGKDQQTRWKCICDCGKNKTILAPSLTSGKTTSCGCLQKEKVSGENNPRWVGGKKYSGYKAAIKSIGFVEEVRRDPNNKKAVQVKCTLCNKWFSPTRSEVQSRKRGLEGKTTPEGWYSEGHLYCSEECKQSCSIYGQQLYPKGHNKTNIRQEAIDQHTRLMVLKRDGNQCQKCGSCHNLEVHHIEGVAQEPMVANDLDNCMTVCHNCHMYIHSQPGCTFYDYRRDPCDGIIKEAVNQ